MLVRSPMRTTLTSPRTTQPNQTLESAPISTSPITVAPGAMNTRGAEARQDAAVGQQSWPPRFASSSDLQPVAQHRAHRAGPFHRRKVAAVLDHHQLRARYLLGHFLAVGKRRQAVLPAAQHQCRAVDQARGRGGCRGASSAAAPGAGTRRDRPARPSPARCRPAPRRPAAPDGSAAAAAAASPP